jgi:pimeloyl-ACP methyl ester carboxylesterase
MNVQPPGPLPDDVLPGGVRSTRLAGVNGLDMHVLEAGFETAGRPCVLLLHGFPELAYSWRKQLPAIAALGYHVVAPDQRGYGRTSGWDADYDGDLASFRMLNLTIDALALVNALGHREVACVVGHDFGSPVAAWCALARPDVFRRVVLMSAPFGAPAALPFATAGAPRAAPTATTPDIHAQLAALPQPRKHYQWYYGTREANHDMWHCPQGVHDFLRAYYHHKSGDWPHNTPFRLAGYSAQSLAQLPTYYVMARDRTMPETVVQHMPSPEQIAANTWLPDHELRVYSEEYARTGFQGGLQWYRCTANARLTADLRLFAGRTIDVPSLFIAGNRDWGVYQTPGAFERMQSHALTNLRGCHLIDGAGHWVQQERPEAVNALLTAFLRGFV